MKEEKKKKPYKPPSIRTEKAYERRSLACGKYQPTGGKINPPSCRGNFKLS